MPFAARVALFLAAVTLAAPPAAAAGGRIKGVVTTEARPAGKRLKVTKDQEHCGDTVADETLIVDDGRLANVVVSVQGAPKTPVEPVEGASLDNLRCAFVPHVQAVTVGTRLLIKNSDPMLHNVHTYGKGDRTLFNLAMPLQGQQVKKKLKKPGLTRVKCDIHEWMSGWVWVFDHPFYAFTGPKGAYTIEGVPPGTWKLTFWHEKLGTKTVDVTVAEGGEARVDLQL